ncbi:MAG: hypothetical protein RI917_481 [Actinomycetota bacterium]
MVEWLFIVALLFSAVLGGFLAMGGLFGLIPKGWVILSVIALEIVLFIQLAVSVGLTIGGARAAISTVEFFGYLLVALLILPGGTLWSLVERNRWSTVILAMTVLTISVMLLRMWQIWSGEPYFG